MLIAVKLHSCIGGMRRVEEVLEVEEEVEVFSCLADP
jgi:hypothetical protein